MALKTKKLSNTVGMQVYTDSAEYLGEIEEAILTGNKVEGWRVKATRGSFLEKALSGAQKEHRQWLRLQEIRKNGLALYKLRLCA